MMRGIVVTGVIVFAVVLFLFCVYVVIESTGFRTVHYSIVTDRITTGSVRIAVLSDLHNKDYGNRNEALFRAIDDFHPDFVCFAGDMITSGWELSYDYSGTLAFIRKVAKKYPVYYGMGNHEGYLNYNREKFPEEYDLFLREIKRMGVIYLDNENVAIPRFGIRIYGLNLPHRYYRRNQVSMKLTAREITERLGAVSSSEFSILLAHHPIHFESYAKWGADLVLSGHIHGGIVSLPFWGGVIAPGYQLFPHYDAGLFREGKSQMLLSRGVGSHTIPIRVNNKAEVICLTIGGEKDESECKTAGL